MSTLINPSDQTITQYNIQTGGASNLLNNVAPSATSGVPLISQGTSSQPLFGTAVVAGGGTGQTTLTNHGVLVGAGSAAITQLSTGLAGQVLQSGGASANPSYSTATFPTGSASAGKVLISDGTNWVASTPTFPNASATSGKFIRSDGTNWIASTPTLPTSAGTSGKVLQSNGTNYVESTPTYPSASGSAGAILRSDGTNNVYTTATYPNTAGTSGNVLTSNGTNWVSQAASGGVSTLTGDSGGALSPSGGTIIISAGTSTNVSGSSVSFSGAGHTLTLNVTDGINSTYIGSGAGNTSVTATQCVGIGHNSLNALTSGGSNTCVGYNSGLKITTGSLNNGSNTCVGSLSGNALTTGVQNCLFGQNTGTFYSGSESNNICIGAGVVGTTSESNAIRIGNTNATTCFIAGINGVTVTGTAVLCATNGQLGTIVSSIRYKENVMPLGKDVSVMHLRPVEFNYKADESKTKQYGLIAEEVHRDFPYLCFYNEAGAPESVKYHELPVLLLKEIQRLNARIEKLEKR